MKRRRKLLALLCGFQIASAWAYRPFEGTDADVAAPTHLELELGTAYVHESAADAWIVPTIVAIYGLNGDREIVLEGELVLTSHAAPDSSGWAAEDTALSVKQMLRRGSLQDQGGATEGVRAALVGLIWETHQDVAIDAAVRYQGTDNEHGWEIRAGFTWIR